MKNNDDPFDVIFKEVYDKNINYLVKYLYLFVNNFSIAEDLAHDIFLRIYRSKNTGITGDKFRNYIKKAARNIVIDHARKLAREDAKNKKIIPELIDLNETFYSSLENSVIKGEVISTVQDVLDNFSEMKRKIFISRVIEHKTRQQVSEEEKISLYAVKRIEDEVLHVMRKELKQYL